MTSNEGRDVIWARLATLPAATPPPRPAPAEITPDAATWDADEQVQRLTEQFTRLHVSYELTDSLVSARLTLAVRLQASGLKRILSWSADEIPLPGLLDALEVLGIEVVVPALASTAIRLRPQELDVWRKRLLDWASITMAITGADAAFAASGTLLTHSGPGRPLLVSQLARQHLVLLPRQRIYPSVEHWLAAARHRGDGAASRVMTFLTGPGRSLDIEATPVLGIHGPSQIHVIITP